MWKQKERMVASAEPTSGTHRRRLDRGTATVGVIRGGRWRRKAYSVDHGSDDSGRSGGGVTVG